jgi:hypothetical protein
MLLVSHVLFSTIIKSWVPPPLHQALVSLFDVNLNIFYLLIQHSITLYYSLIGTPVSSTTKTGRHDIAELLLKMVLNTIKQTNIMLSI